MYYFPPYLINNSSERNKTIFLLRELEQCIHTLLHNVYTACTFFWLFSAGTFEHRKLLVHILMVS